MHIASRNYARDGTAEIINIGKYIFGHEEHYTILVGLDIFYLELTENN